MNTLLSGAVKVLLIPNDGTHILTNVINAGFLFWVRLLRENEQYFCL